MVNAEDGVEVIFEVVDVGTEPPPDSFDGMDGESAETDDMGMIIDIVAGAAGSSIVELGVLTVVKRAEVD